MSMVKNKKLSRFIVAVLAVMTILAYSVPASVSQVSAASVAPTGERPGWDFFGNTEVNFTDQPGGVYHHKFISTDTPPSGKYDAFCLNPNKNMEPDAYPHRSVWDVYEAEMGDHTKPLIEAVRANKQSTTYDTNYTPDSNEHNDDIAKKLSKILYYGYLNNQGNFKLSDNDLYDATQLAVYNIAVGGLHTRNELPIDLYDGNSTTRSAINTLLDYAYDDNIPTPTGGWMAVALCTYGDFGGQHLLIGNWGNKTPPLPEKFTVKISKKALGGNEVEGAHIVVKKGDTTVAEWDSTKTAKELTVEAGNYVMTETVAPKGYKKVTTEIKFSVGNDGKVSLETTSVNNGGKINITGNHIVLENAPENTPDNDENNDKGKLRTTVSAGDKTASATAAISLTADEAAEITSIIDKIDYEGLVGGATYNVQGTLMDVTNASNPTAVATSEAKDFKADASGKGTWEVEFKNVQLEAGRKFVVFESATRTTDADGNEITGGETLKHEDVNDKAQTIIVGQSEDEEYTSNLSATKTTDTKTATVGDVIPYTITITNDGNADAKDVKVTDVIGEYLKYVSDDSKGNNVGQNVNWTVDVPAGSSIEIAIDCEVTEGATGKLINKVLIIDSTNPDDIQEYEDNATVAFAPPEDEDDGSDSSKKGDAASQSKKSLAATSDEFNLGLWAILATISGLALAAGALRRRYER